VCKIGLKSRRIHPRLRPMNPRIYYLSYRGNTDRLAYINSYMLSVFSGDIIRMYDKEDIEGSVARWYTYDKKENYIATTEIASTLLVNAHLSSGNRSAARQMLQFLHERILVPPSPDVVLSITPKRLSLTNLSLNLKHRVAWERGTSRRGCDYLLIFEDDVLIKDVSAEIVRSLTDNDLYGFDYIDLAGGANLSGFDVFPLANGDIHHISTYSTRTTCAYLMRTTLALQLLSTKIPILFPIDFQLTYLFNIIRPRVGWLDPPPFDHGSVIGKYAVSNER